jgi:hypothetical protein
MSNGPDLHYGAGGADQAELQSNLLSAISPLALEYVDNAFWIVLGGRKTRLFLVGMVVLRSMIRVNTPPSVSIPTTASHVEQ